MAYTIEDWYWIASDGPVGQVYSSAQVNYVPLDNPNYVAFLAKGNIATKIDSVASLQIVLATGYPAGSAGVSPTAKAASFDTKYESVIAGGFRYDLSAYTTPGGVSIATFSPNGTPGLLTLQMDMVSQINWLGMVSQAQLAIASGAPTTMMQIRVLENINVVLPATDIITVLSAAAVWTATQVFIRAGLKDQLAAIPDDPATAPAAMALINWPT